MPGIPLYACCCGCACSSAGWAITFADVVTFPGTGSATVGGPFYFTVEGEFVNGDFVIPRDSANPDGVGTCFYFLQTGNYGPVKWAEEAVPELGRPYFCDRQFRVTISPYGTGGQFRLIAESHSFLFSGNPANVVFEGIFDWPPPAGETSVTINNTATPWLPADGDSPIGFQGGTATISCAPTGSAPVIPGGEGEDDCGGGDGKCYAIYSYKFNCKTAEVIQPTTVYESGCSQGVIGTSSWQYHATSGDVIELWFVQAGDDCTIVDNDCGDGDPPADPTTEELAAFCPDCQPCSDLCSYDQNASTAKSNAYLSDYNTTVNMSSGVPYVSGSCYWQGYGELGTVTDIYGTHTITYAAIYTIISGGVLTGYSVVVSSSGGSVSYQVNATGCLTGSGLIGDSGTGTVVITNNGACATGEGDGGCTDCDFAGTWHGGNAGTPSAVDDITIGSYDSGEEGWPFTTPTDTGFIYCVDDEPLQVLVAFDTAGYSTIAEITDSCDTIGFTNDGGYVWSM